MKRAHTQTTAQTGREGTPLAARDFGTDPRGQDRPLANSHPISDFQTPTRKSARRSRSKDRLIELPADRFIPMAGGTFDVIDAAPNAEAQMVEDARRHELTTMLARELPDAQYAVVMLMSGLVDDEQYTAGAVADMLGISVSTVQHRYRDGIEKLRRCPEIRELLRG